MGASSHWMRRILLLATTAESKQKRLCFGPVGRSDLVIFQSSHIFAYLRNPFLRFFREARPRGCDFVTSLPILSLSSPSRLLGIPWRSLLDLPGLKIVHRQIAVRFWSPRPIAHYKSLRLSNNGAVLVSAPICKEISYDITRYRYTYIYIHLYTYIYIHLHTYTYIHIFI